MRDTTKIIGLRSQHFDRILEIERASFGRYAYRRSLFRELQVTCRGLFFVARHGGTVAGYAVAHAEGETAEIVSIAVDPDMRHAGVGSELLRHLLEVLSGRGVKRVTLTVRVANHSAIRFYRSFRFRRMRLIAGYYEDGADAWLMRKLL